MTTAQLVTLLRQKFGQTTADVGVLDLDIVAFLNDRQVELCSDSDVLVSAWTASTVAGQQQYSVPPEYTSVEFVNLYQTTGGMAKKALEKVDMDEIPPDKAPGNPDRFARWGLNVSSANARAFWLYPVPTSATVSPNDLECFGRQLPLAMVSGGQAPEVSDRWQRAIVDGALALLYLRLARTSKEYLPLADRFEAKWQAHKSQAQGQELLDVYKPGHAKNTAGYGMRY